MSGYRCVREAWVYVLCSQGIKPDHTRQIYFNYQRQWLKMLLQDLSKVKTLGESDFRLVRLSTQQVAHACAKKNRIDDSPLFLTEQLVCTVWFGVLCVCVCVYVCVCVCVLFCCLLSFLSPDFFFWFVFWLCCFPLPPARLQTIRGAFFYFSPFVVYLLRDQTFSGAAGVCVLHSIEHHELDAGPTFSRTFKYFHLCVL